jgi:hypothetical protein
VLAQVLKVRRLVGLIVVPARAVPLLRLVCSKTKRNVANPAINQRRQLAMIWPLSKLERKCRLDLVDKERTEEARVQGFKAESRLRHP